MRIVFGNVNRGAAKGARGSAGISLYKAVVAQARKFSDSVKFEMSFLQAKILELFRTCTKQW